MIDSTISAAGTLLIPLNTNHIDSKIENLLLLDDLHDISNGP
jgi:hypothetical protein